MIDLTREQRQLVRRILQHRLPTRQAQIFGSRAKGTAKPWSDLNIVILGEPPVDSLALAEARADFKEFDLPFREDLTLWRDLPENLQQHIAQTGQSL